MMDHLDPIAAGQVDAVVGLVRETLGDAVAGCYLFGSAVRGGLRPDSDLDVLVVVDRGTTVDERRVLIDGLLARSRSRCRAGVAARASRDLGEADDPWDDAGKALARADADAMLAAIAPGA